MSQSELHGSDANRCLQTWTWRSTGNYLWNRSCRKHLDAGQTTKILQRSQTSLDVNESLLRCISQAVHHALAPVKPHSGGGGVTSRMSWTRIYNLLLQLGRLSERLPDSR